MQNSDFHSLSDLSDGIFRELASGLSTRVFVGDQAMLSVVSVEPNAAGRLHSHPEEQWGFLIKGSGIRTQDGQSISVTAGDFWRTPGGTSHSFEAGPDGATVLDFFAPPREEYKKTGKGFGAD